MRGENIETVVVSALHEDHLACACAGCSTSHDAFKGIQLPAARPSVGLATAHGHHILIHSNARLPARAQQLFTTLHDGQDTVRTVVEEVFLAMHAACTYAPLSTF